MSQPGPSHEAVLSALERLLAWPELARSPQLASFLQYIVRRTLEGQEQSIKAYSIAVDVFGRPANFDPQSDPIVRVQARRLRALLNDYYAQSGQNEPFQIRLPTGRYIPEFVSPVSDTGIAASREPVPLPSPAKKIVPFRVGLFALLLLGLALAGFAANRWSSSVTQQPGVLGPPIVAIMEWTNLTNGGTDAPMVSGLAIELVTDLEQFETISVRYAGSLQEQAGLSLGVDFVLTGVAREDGDMVQYSALLTDTTSQAVVWNKTISLTRERTHEAAILDELSRSFSLVLGSPRGPLHSKARAWAIADENHEDPANLYLCRALFDLYRETGDGTKTDRTRQCIQSLAEPDRTSPISLAIAAILAAEHPIIEGDGARSEVLDQSLNELNRAIGASPVSSFIWEQHARLQHARGQTAMALADYGSALQLNPANSDALAAYGTLLALTGAVNEARPMLRDAVEGSPEPPPSYFAGPTAVALIDQDYARAAQFAERYAQADRELGPVLAVVAGQGAGNSAIVDRYLPQIMDVPEFQHKGILPRLRQTVTDPALMDAIRRGLAATGVPANALEQPF